MLVTLQNCTKCLEISLLFYNLHIFAPHQVKEESNNLFLLLLFILEQLEQLSEKLRTSCSLVNLEHLVEIIVPKIISISWISTKWTFKDRCMWSFKTEYLDPFII